MALIVLVVWIVLMLFWLCFGSYSNWDPNRPVALGNTLIPWICVLIVGLVAFGAFGPMVISQPAPVVR